MLLIHTYIITALFATVLLKCNVALAHDFLLSKQVILSESQAVEEPNSIWCLTGHYSYLFGQKNPSKCNEIRYWHCYSIHTSLMTFLLLNLKLHHASQEEVKEMSDVLNLCLTKTRQTPTLVRKCLTPTHYFNHCTCVTVWLQIFVAKNVIFIITLELQNFLLWNYFMWELTNGIFSTKAQGEYASVGVKWVCSNTLERILHYHLQVGRYHGKSFR